MVEINYWTNGKICAKVAFPSYTESVKFRSQSRETASKREATIKEINYLDNCEKRRCP